MKKVSKRFYRLSAALLAAIMIITAPIYSYMEVQAAEFMIALGSYALEDILMDLIITSGLAVAGYQSAKSVSKGSSEYESLKKELEANATVAEAIRDVGSHHVSAAGTAVNDEDYVGAGYSIHGSSGTLQFQLDSGLIKASQSSVLSWLESEDNVIEAVASTVDEGTVSVGRDYCPSITTSVVNINDRLFDASFLDTLTFSGVYDKLCELGYSSDEYYYYCRSIGGSSVSIYCIPLNCSIMYLKRSNSYYNIFDNDVYKTFCDRIGYIDTDSLYNNFLKKNYTNCDVFTFESDLSYSKSSSSWCPSLQGGSFTGYLFNYNKAYSLYSSVVAYYILSNNDGCDRKFFSFTSKSSNISYLPDSALAVSGGLTYAVPASNASGLVADGTSLDDMYDYVTSLTVDLDAWREEQNAFNADIYDQNNTLIGQNAEALDALNSIDTASNNTYQRLTKMHTLISSMNTSIGSMVGTVVSVVPMAIYGVSDAVKALPDEFEDVIEGVFPWAGTFDDVITALPGDIASAIADVVDIPDVVIPDIAVDIPDIVIPDIVVDIPDIVIPDIVVDIPDIVIPDIAVDIPDITLDPTYDITVANDYGGLADIISDAVADGLDDLFIPDEAVTLDKVGEVGEYFQIKDDVELAVGEFKDYLFGITPSPILKIPIGSPTSKKYNYGLGDYFIIDISWYSQYKDFADKIILAIAWALFLWRVFLKLPGIISGTEGSILSVYNSQEKYNNIVYPKSKKG